MRDDDGRSAGAQTPQRGEYDLLGDGVERRGRLVEDENRRILQNRARDAEALALAARQPAAGLGDFGVISFRQSRDELVRVRRARGFLDLLRRRVEATVAQVVGDRSGEQDRILQHDRDLLAQRADAVLADVDAVDRQAAAGRVVEPRNQTDERRLAGAGQADQRNHLARLGGERDVVQHARAVRVRELDLLDADLTGDRVRFDRIGIVDRLGNEGEHRAHALRAGERPLQLPGGVRDRRERSVHRAEVTDDEIQIADRQLPLHHEVAADDHDDRGAENGNRAHDDREERLLPRNRNPRVHRRVAGRAVPTEFMDLAREALDEPHRAERLVQPLQQLGFELFDALFAIHQRRRVVPQAQVQERDDGQRQQADRHVLVEQEAEHHDQRRKRRREREDAAHHEVLDRVRVHVDAVDGVGGARRDVMMQAERGEVLEEPAAQVVHHPLARIDLHLRPVRRHELIDDLQEYARHDDRDEEREPMRRRERRQPRHDARQRSRQGVAGQEVEDDGEGPRLKPAERDLRGEQHRQQRDLGAMWLQERERPAEKARLTGRVGLGHPPIFLAGAIGRCGTRFGAIFGMISGTTRSVLESATYRSPRRGA